VSNYRSDGRRYTISFSIILIAHIRIENFSSHTYPRTNLLLQNIGKKNYTIKESLGYEIPKIVYISLFRSDDALNCLLCLLIACINKQGRTKLEQIRGGSIHIFLLYRGASIYGNSQEYLHALFSY
jgi:hypothetical protein